MPPLIQGPHPMVGGQEHIFLELPVGAKAVVPVDPEDRPSLTLVVMDETYPVRGRHRQVGA